MHKARKYNQIILCIITVSLFKQNFKCALQIECASLCSYRMIENLQPICFCISFILSLLLMHDISPSGLYNLYYSSIFMKMLISMLLNLLIKITAWQKVICSNYDIFLTRDCLAYAKIKPAVNQIETHPYFQRDSLVKFCQKHEVCVTAHTPLGGAAANTEWFGTVSCLDDQVLKVS